MELFWHESAAFQRSAFGWSTAGNDAQKSRGRHLSRPRRPFWGPLAGGAALQAVRRCRRCGVAGGERVPPAPLG